MRGTTAMDYDPSEFCDMHCPGRDFWLSGDQPCSGTGHATSEDCAACATERLRRQEAEERQVFRVIEERRSDPEFMARLQRHVDENRAVLDIANA